MPLSDLMPVLDDRRYDDIIAEIRTRIARYTPEWNPVWSDVNDNDPGITLTQVFAWLAEMLLYRMNRVPELNYLKFLQLLGIELAPAEPAQMEIAFPVLEDYEKPYVIVPSRTQVAAEADDGGPPLVFETERALYALTVPLFKVQAFDGYAYTDVTWANTDEVEMGFQPFGPLAAPGSALLLGFKPGSKPSSGSKPTSDAFRAPEINLAVTLAGDAQAVSPVQCGLPATFKSALQWEFWGTLAGGRTKVDNATPPAWHELNPLEDETLDFTRSGHVYLKLKDPDNDLVEAVIGAVPDSLFWIRAYVKRSRYEKPPRLRAIRTNTVAARQAQTIGDEVLGGSNGGRNQKFQLANAPVLQGSLQLTIDEGTGAALWTAVADFFGSKRDDSHYVLNRATGEIRFGDGVNGRIPVGNVDNPDGNITAREYRFGGGSRGNVAAGKLKTLLTPVDGIDANGVTNLLAAHSGRDEETVAAAQKRVPSTIKSRDRAVTPEDFEHLATQAANVRRAKALPLFHPQFPGVDVPGVITVIVVPDAPTPKQLSSKDTLDLLPSQEIFNPNPLPSEDTLRAVCVYLDQRRLLTTEVYVIQPTYRKVQIDAEVVTTDTADTAEVKKAIENTLLIYFHPLVGGEDGQGWPFGGTIFFSRIYQRLFTVPGVQSIARLMIIVDGEAVSNCTDKEIGAAELVYSTEHTLLVHYRYDVES